MKSGVIIIVLVAAVITAATFYFRPHTRSPDPSALSTNSIHWERVSSDEISKLHEESTKLSEDDFDAFYDSVVKVVTKHGSFSDGGLDPADFSSSRYVDPCTCVIIASEKVMEEALAHDMSQALKHPERIRNVIFDSTRGQYGITSDGRFLRSR